MGATIFACRELLLAADSCLHAAAHRINGTILARRAELRLGRRIPAFQITSRDLHVPQIVTECRADSGRAIHATPWCDLDDPPRWSLLFPLRVSPRDAAYLWPLRTGFRPPSAAPATLRTAADFDVRRSFDALRATFFDVRGFAFFAIKNLKPFMSKRVERCLRINDERSQLLKVVQR